ncbi:MAG: extracellular solute-binding protein [Methylacidiphilales bacterium]|nr:extracellular solute-binding protein [Candidatus Methylacidiphilales bacterium]
MKRVALLLSFVVVLISCTKNEETNKVLHVYNWNGYNDETTLPEFEKRFGVKVVLDNYDTNEVLEAKLLVGKSGYDIVVPSANFAERFISSGLLLKLDKSKIPNLKNVDPVIAEKLQAYDPGNQYLVDFMWGSLGIGINTEKVKKRLGNVPLDSWKLLFDASVVKKLGDCGVGLLDDAELYTLALHYLGLDYKVKTKENLDKAQKLLMSIRPYVRYIDSTKYKDDLASGEICISLAYNGDILQSQELVAQSNNNFKVEYILPKEGSIVWFDTIAIPADAPNPELAHLFINYILEPQVSANLSNYINYANANKESLPLIDDKIKNNPVVYPNEKIMSTLFPTKQDDQEITRYVTELFTKFKSSIK